MKLVSIVVGLCLLSSSASAECGIASVYGGSDHLCGRPTATGERLDCHGMTAAHKTRSLGSHVRVTNTSNGKSVNVRINDRGPFNRRIIDLVISAGAAIGISGLGHVCID